jgi:hypothetical protein
LILVNLADRGNHNPVGLTQKTLSLASSHDLHRQSVHFLGIGAQKAGTTWLFRQLSRHPQLLFPQGKEMHFWNRHHHGEGDGPQWVNKLQSEVHHHPDGRPILTGEMTPAYAILPRETIAAVHELCPRIRLFIVLRNPIERASGLDGIESLPD